MADRYITDGAGRLWEVIEGELSQGGTYRLQWQDLADEIAAEEAGGTDRCCAVGAVLRRHGRGSVFVKRIPNDADPAPSEGVQRVYSWNVTIRGGRAPGMLLVANERPSRAWKQAERDRANTELVTLDEAIATADAEIDRDQADLDAATTLTAYRQRVEAGTVDRLRERRAERERLTGTREQAARSIGAQDRYLAALDALGGDCLSVVVVERKLAEMAAR